MLANVWRVGQLAIGAFAVALCAACGGGDGGGEVRVAFVHGGDADLLSAQQFQVLLEGDGYAVDLVPMSAVPGTDFSAYRLILIGDESGSGATWGAPGDAAALNAFEVPVLGIGEGGYAFFGLTDPFFGYPNGSASNAAATESDDMGHPVWHDPHSISVAGPDVTLYSVLVPVVRLKGLTPVQTISTGAGPTAYADLAAIQRWGYWGFGGDPLVMTADGRAVFLNFVYYLVNLP